MLLTGTRCLLVVLFLFFPLAAGAAGDGKPEAEQPEPVIIGVLDFLAKDGASPETAARMAALLVQEIELQGNVRAIGESELRALLTANEQDDLVNFDWKCPAEGIVATHGKREPAVRWVVSGTLTAFGKLQVLTLKIFDLKSRTVAGRVIRKIRGGPEELRSEISEATEMLFEEAADKLELVQTVTVASRRIQLLEKSPSAVSVYTREDIRSSGAVDLADFLRRVPGFDIYRLKPAWPLVGSRAMTSMSNNLVLPIIDGREALLELTGFTLWSGLTIDVEEIERLEVIRGPGSALYGANAFAGVVSITTVSREPGRRFNVFMRTGEVGHQRIFGRLRDKLDLGKGSLSYGIGFGFDEKASTSDFRDETSGTRSHGYISYRQINKLELALHAGIVQGDTVFFHNMGDWRLSNSLNYWLMAKGDVTFTPNAELKTQIYFSRMSTNQFYRTQVKAYNIWIADLPDNRPLSSSLDAKCQLDWQLVDNLMIVSGANLRYTTVEWDKIFLSPYDEVRAAGFLQVQWRPLHELQLTGGLRLDLNTLTDTATSPRVVAVYSPWKRHSFRFGYGLAFRKPSAYETKAHGVIEDFNLAIPEFPEKIKTQIGNENLRNEKVHSIEAGWRANFLDDRLRTSVDFYYNLYRDTIGFIMDIPHRLGLPDIANSTFRFENQGIEADALGGEAELNWRPTDELSLWCNFGIRHVVRTDTDKRVPSEPIFRFNLGGRYTPEEGMTADIALHYLSEYEMPLIDPKNVFDNPRLVRLGRELVLVGRLGYRLSVVNDSAVEVGLNVVTPLGGQFREYPGAPVPQWNELRHLSDFGGEKLIRLVSFYLRGAF